MGKAKANKENDEKRNPNFTEKEKLTLIQFVKDNKGRLFGKAGHCSAKVEERKKKTWKLAAEVLRSAGGPKIREWKEIKTQWTNLKGKAVKYDLKKKQTGGGPPPDNNPIYESLLTAIAPEARDGVKGQVAEANPMGGSQTESSQSSQDLSQDFSQDSDVFVPVQQTATSSKLVTQRAPIGTSMTTKPVLISSKSSSTPQTPLMTPIPSTTPPKKSVSKKPSATSVSTRGNDIRYLQVQERMLKYEEERVGLMRETLQVQKKIANSLEEINKALLFKSLQPDI